MSEAYVQPVVDIALGIFSLVLYCAVALLGMTPVRRAVGKYRYGCGGKLQSKRSPIEGKQGYDYYQLKKPWWTPPTWFIIIIWALIYILGSYAFWRLLRTVPSTMFVVAIVFNLINLILNILWGYVFYEWRNSAGAIVTSVLMFLTALVVLILYGMIAASGTLSWTAFAVYLIYPVWIAVTLVLQVQIQSLNWKSKSFFGRRVTDADDTSEIEERRATLEFNKPQTESNGLDFF